MFHEYAERLYNVFIVNYKLKLGYLVFKNNIDKSFPKVRLSGTTCIVCMKTLKQNNKCEGKAPDKWLCVVI